METRRLRPGQGRRLQRTRWKRGLEMPPQGRRRQAAQAKWTRRLERLSQCRKLPGGRRPEQGKSLAWELGRTQEPVTGRGEAAERSEVKGQGIYNM